MHNFSPTSPVLGDLLQLLPAQTRLRDVCLKVMSPGVFWSGAPSLSFALRVPRQGLSRNVAVWLFVLRLATNIFRVSFVD